MEAIHIMTQIHENYGAHDWDGNGEVPQMWKAKGGEDYIIEGAPSIEDAEHFVEYRVCSSDEYSTEEIVLSEEVEEGFRTEKEISSSELAPVRIDWSKRFESRYCKGEWYSSYSSLHNPQSGM